MLKWTSKFKYGGSVPEGLDRIDAMSTPRRETQSCRIRAEARSNPSSPKSRSRKTNAVMYRSQSELADRRHSYENDEQYHKMRQQKSKSAILENLSSPAINSSPFINLQYEDLYKRFEQAHLSAPSSPQSDNEDFNLTPKTSRQTSCSNSLRKNSPANLPCIEEAAENDELLSIADSGICDEEYNDHKKHYFEPCKFGDEANAKNQQHNENTDNEIFRKYSPCPRSLSLPTEKTNNFTQKLQRMESSDETDSSSDNEHISFECPRSSSPKHIDIDSKNQELYSKLKADLESTAMGKKSVKRDIPHSLMSSMLWKGNTSNQPPSSTGIYTTVPPNRYGRRNKDLMSQLSSNNSSTPSTPSPPSSPKSPGSPREFKVSLDVSHYAPDEILVTLEDGKLVVNGKHFAESEYGFESLQFHRRYPIPDGIKKADIKSTITDEGILVITGRVNEPMIEEPALRRSLSSSGHTTPEIMLSGEHTKLSPSPSRRSIATSDYSEDSRSRLSEDSRSISSNISDNDFHETADNTYMLTVNCRGYDPQDLDIKIQSRELIIHGRQKICSVENGHERVRHKEFNKRYAVPRNANCHQIMSRFTEDEQLVVEIKKSSTIKRGVIREDILDDE
uniref:Heat shock protein n=1 Tax=Clytia hemisphaerica TaxID=252671 RepID=A0A069DM31_9CNID